MQGAVRSLAIRLVPSTLRARLFALLLALGAVTALAVGGATYGSVKREADELFDYQLQQMASSLRDQGRIADEDGATLTNPDLDVVIQVWSVEGIALYTSRPRERAQLLPPRAVLGFSQLRLGGEDWRVYATATPLRVVQVAQPLAVRRRLAADAAVRSVLPVAAAMPLVALALWWVIGVSLAPLQRVVREAGSRGAGSLQALPMGGLPGELVPLVAAFNALLARLSEAFEAQRHFVADAAHELRSPLTALKLQIGLLAGAQPGAETEAAAQRLRQGVDRATRLVEQLLALARAEPGAGPAMAAVDLAELARQAIADAMPLAERRGVVLGLESPPTVPVSGDAQALVGALRNLLDNASRYGARRAVLSVRGRQVPHGGWQVQVDDDGPGIPMADRERVFARFQRLAPGDAEGSGLGLAIVQAVARRHGATVRLDDSPLGGLRVTLHAPASDAGGLATTAATVVPPSP